MLRAKYIGMLVVGTLFILFAILLTNNASADWSSDKRLSSNILMESRNPKIETIRDEVHVAWMDESKGMWDIFYTNSSDRGETFKNDYSLTDGNSSSIYPDMAIYGNNVYVVYCDNATSVYEVYLLKKSSNSNEELKWGKPILVAKTEHNSSFPAIAVLGSEIHVVWEENVNNSWEIYYVKGIEDNTGIKWETPIPLTKGQGYSLRPKVAVEKAYKNNKEEIKVHVVWQDNRTGNTEIYYNHSEDGGKNWDKADTLLSKGKGSSFNPKIELGGSSVIESTIHVVWWDNSDDNGDGNFEIYYKRYKKKTWESEKRITNNIYNSSYPSLAVIGQYLYVVWQDNRNGNWEIYYTYSKDGGDTWDLIGERLTNDPSTSAISDIGVYGQNIHVVWHDNRLWGELNIYYKRSPPFEPQKEPVIYLDSPIGGEEWAGEHTIRWSSQHFKGDTTYTIKLSTDGGENWKILTKVVKDENGDYHTYYYDFNTTDYSDSNISIVNVTGDNGTHQAYDQSENFTIDNTPPTTSSDLSEGWQKKMFFYLYPSDGEIGSGFDNTGTTYYKIDDNDYEEGIRVEIEEAGEHTIKYYSVDDAGNKEEENSVIGYFDDVAPTFGTWNIPEVHVDITNSIEVSIDVYDQEELSGLNESKLKMYYAVSKEINKNKIKEIYWINNETDATLDEKKAKIEISDINWKDFENFYFYVKCKAYDKAGNNNETISDGKLIIDKTPPYLTILKPKFGDAYGNVVEIVFKALNISNDFIIKYKPRVGSLVEICEFKNSELVDNTGTYIWNTTDVEMDYNYKIKIEVKGLEVSNESGLFMIDHTSPITADNIKPYWKNSNLEVLLLPNDPPFLNGEEASGVNKTYYRIDGEDWKIEYGNKITFLISEEGEHKIEFYSVDNVSNTENVNEKTAKIDKTNPTIGEWNIPDITYESLSKQIISVNVSDELSGINAEESMLYWYIYNDGTLSMDDVPKWEEMNTTYSESRLIGNLKVNWTENGDRYLYIKCKVKDNAGNFVEEMGNVELIDKESVAKTWKINISSFVGSDTDNRYFVGKTVRIVVKEETGRKGLSATIKISSTSQQYILAPKKMSYDESTNTFTFEWNTTNLMPADDYIVNVTLEDVIAEISKSKTLKIILEEQFVDFKIEGMVFKIKGKEISKASEGDTVNIELKLIVEGEFDGSVSIDFFSNEPSKNKPIGFMDFTPTGKNNIVNYTWYVPKDFKGSHTIYAVVDKDNKIEETNENNNQASAKIDIKKGEEEKIKEEKGLPIYVIVIPIVVVAVIGGVFLYLKSQEEYEYEEEEEEE